MVVGRAGDEEKENRETRAWDGDCEGRRERERERKRGAARGELKKVKTRPRFRNVCSIFSVELNALINSLPKFGFRFIIERGVSSIGPTTR